MITYTKGMRVDVLRCCHDCTNGPTQTADCIILVGPGIPEIFEVGPSDVVMYLDRRPDGLPCAKPLDSTTTGKWYMFGGNFLWTSDSRFREISDHPIPVHDRHEDCSFGDTYMAVEVKPSGIEGSSTVLVQCPNRMSY